MPQILHDETGTSYLGMTVAALIFNESGQVLLIKENYGQHRYGPPGGRIEAGESPKQAVMREALEEICVQVQVSRLIGIYQTERKAPGFQPRGEKRVLVWGLGRGNPLPMPNHLTVTSLSGTLVPVSRGHRASHVPQGLRELRSAEDV